MHAATHATKIKLVESLLKNIHELHNNEAAKENGDFDIAYRRAKKAYGSYHREIDFVFNGMKDGKPLADLKHYAMEIVNLHK